MLDARIGDLAILDVMDAVEAHIKKRIPTVSVVEKLYTILSLALYTNVGIMIMRR